MVYFAVRVDVDVPTMRVYDWPDVIAGTEMRKPPPCWPPGPPGHPPGAPARGAAA